MSFPLLRLPDLALEEILKNYNNEEILFLVQTSQKSKRLISRHTKSHSTKIEVIDGVFRSYFKIFCDDQHFFRIKIKTEREGFDSSWRLHTPVPVRNEGDTLVSCWKSRVQGFKEILDFLKEIFRIEKVSFELHLAHSCWAVPIVEHCVSKNLKIGSVYWSNFTGSIDMAKRLLMAVKNASDFFFRGFNPASFRFNHFHLFRMDQLQIENAAWITAEQVVALRNCKRIGLQYVMFKEPSINQILRKLLEDPRELHLLQIFCSDEIRPEEIINGLNIVRIEELIDMRGHKYWLTGRNGIIFSISLGHRTIIITRETELLME